MKIVINVEKKHLYFLIIFLAILGVGIVIATTHGDAQSHPILYTNTIEGRDQASVTVNDDLTIATGKNLCLNGVCNSVWPSGLSGTGAINYLTKWTGANSIGSSVVYETNGKIRIGTDDDLPTTTLLVAGSLPQLELRDPSQAGGVAGPTLSGNYIFANNKKVLTVSDDLVVTSNSWGDVVHSTCSRNAGDAGNPCYCPSGYYMVGFSGVGGTNNDFTIYCRPL